ncbi:ABC transporter substrate-binding protein [Alcaligenaceae bacterium]|nr:ABC transporter substrate-binding protein [Alcaligenaceae bacterium]
MTHQRALTLLVLFCTALSFILGIQNSHAADTKNVRFRMEWIPSGMYAPLFLTIHAGYDKEQGIKIDMRDGNGSLAAINEVTGKHADLGMASCGALATAISKGQPVVSVAQYMAKYSWGFYIPADSEAKTIKELAGRSVSMSPSSSEAVLLPAVMEIAGMKQDDMRKIAVDPSQKIAVYGRSQADSVITTVAYGDPIVQDARPSKYLLWADAGFVMPDYCIFTRTDTVENNPQMIQKFLAATFKGIKQAQSDPDAAIDATLKQRPLLRREHTAKQWMLTSEFMRSENSGQCPMGWHPPEDWSAGLETLQKYAGLQGDITKTEAYYTNQFIGACH